MTKFEIGKEYTHGWIGDCELFTTWKVLDRTEKTITITDGRETKKCKIVEGLTKLENAESVRPFGKYSMCPVLVAR